MGNYVFAKKQALLDFCGLMQYHKSSYQTNWLVHHYQKNK